jgi:hypothetical protein
MPIDPRKLADIMQRMQLARQAGAAGGLPPSGEYNGGGDIVTQDAPMQQMPQPQQLPHRLQQIPQQILQQMPQPMQGQGQMSDADMMRLQQMRATQNRMPPR